MVRHATDQGRSRREHRGTDFFFQAEDGIRDWSVTGVQTCALPISDELAALGYLALAPDLYRGTVAKTPEEAGKLMGAMVQGYATSVELSAIAYLKANAAGAKIATIGWCMGGGQSLQASIASPGDVAATVIYYGMPESDPVRLKTLRGPVLGLYAKKDGWI